MENKLQKLHTRLCSCAVFRGVLDHPVFSLFCGYCYMFGEDEGARMDAYAAFVSEIYANGGNLTYLVQKLVFADENVYIKAMAKKQNINAHILSAAERELKIFAEFAALTADDFAVSMGVSLEEIPAFDSFNADMVSLYKERLQNIQKYGYGIFSSNCMFRLSDEKEIEPIVSADKIAMDSFIGYEAQRDKVIANTRAFVENHERYAGRILEDRRKAQQRNQLQLLRRILRP